MTVQSFFSRPGSIGIFWGVLGGIALIVVTMITTNGYLQLVPYFFILYAAIVTTKYSPASAAKFTELLKSGLFSFVISSIVLYVYLLTVVNPNSGITLTGHLWRFGVIVAMGFTSSSIISFLAKAVR